MSTKTLPAKKQNAKVVPTPVKEIDRPGDMEFSFSGVLSRHRVAKSGDRHTSYLRGSALREFLHQAPKTSERFEYKSFQYNSDLGSGDYYLILHFGMECGAIEKIPGGYQIVDRQALIDAWDNGMRACMFSPR